MLPILVGRCGAAFNSIHKLLVSMPPSAFKCTPPRCQSDPHLLPHPHLARAATETSKLVLCKLTSSVLSTVRMSVVL